MGIYQEWCAFAALGVEYLGMPAEAMPFYDGAKKWHRKAKKILGIVMKAGNFGHNIDSSYRSRYSKMTSNVITFWRRFGEFARIACIFPGHAPRFFVTYLGKRV